MKKILYSLLLILIVGVNCLLSACSLVTINNSKYLAQTVAKVDNVEIYMEDLILGYNSFGYQYVQNNGMTNEEAVKKTLEDLIDRELLFEEAKNVIGELSLTHQNEVWQEVFDAINSQVKEYVDDIVKSENLTLPTSEESTATTKEEQFKEYEKKVVRVENQDHSYRYERVEEEKEPEDTILLNQFTLKEYGIEGLASRGFAKYINATKKGRDEYKKLTTDEIFAKEQERIYEIYEKNKYLTLFQEKYEKNMPINLEAVVEKYKELVRNSAFTYSIDKNSYNSKMQSASGEIYYHPYEKEFIQVAHILIKYDDEQQAKVDALKKKLENGSIDVGVYEQQVKIVASEIKAKEKVDGEFTGNLKTVNEVYSEIQGALSGNLSDSKKLEKFIEYIEKYNEDPGMISAINSQTQYYTINLDTSVTDTMVKEFADASRAMYSQDGSKDYTLYMEPVLTDYGYHIIFSLGVVENHFSNLNNLNNVTVSYLYENDIMEGTNKSLFDKMIELVDISEYAEYQNSVIANLRHGKTIHYYKSAYERLYK